MQFDVRAGALATEVRVWATGEMDLASAPALRRTLHRVVEPGRTVVVEMAGVRLLDSVGLGLLLGAHRRLVEVGGRLVLNEPDQRARDLLAVTGVDRTIEVRTEEATGA